MGRILHVHRIKKLQRIHLSDLFLKRGRLHIVMGSFKKAGEDFEQASLLSKKKRIPVNIAKALLALANLAYLEGKIEKSLSLLSSVELYMKGHRYLDLDFKFWRYKGNVFRLKGDYRAALRCYKKCFQQTEKSIGTERKAIILNLIGLAYRGAGKHREAVEYIKRANKMFKKIGDTAAQGSCLGNIGLVYTFSNRASKAIPYFQKALVILKNTQSKGLMTSPLLNWGIALYELGRYDEALKKWQEALEMIREQGDLSALSMLYNNIGYLLMKKNDYEESLKYLNMALDLKQKLNLTGYLPSTYNGLAETYHKLYLKTKKTSYLAKAEQSVKKAFAISKSFKNKHDIKVAKEIFKTLGIKPT